MYLVSLKGRLNHQSVLPSGKFRHANKCHRLSPLCFIASVLILDGSIFFRVFTILLKKKKKKLQETFQEKGIIVGSLHHIHYLSMFPTYKRQTVQVIFNLICEIPQVTYQCESLSSG